MKSRSEHKPFHNNKGIVKSLYIRGLNYGCGPFIVTMGGAEYYKKTNKNIGKK